MTDNYLLWFLLGVWVPASVATWRITALLVTDKGPALIFWRLRRWVGVIEDDTAQFEGNFVAQVLSCFACASVWVGEIVGFSVIMLTWRMAHGAWADLWILLLAAIAYGLSLSGVAMVIQYMARWLRTAKELAAIQADVLWMEMQQSLPNNVGVDSEGLLEG